MSCGVPGCRFPRETPSGNRNFMCKFWRIKQQEKQKLIQQQLDITESKSTEAAKIHFDVDKLLVIRENFIRSGSSFDIKEHLLKSSFSGDIEKLTKQFNSVEIKEKIVKKNIDQAQQIKQEIKPVQVPQLFDERAKTAINQHSIAIESLIKRVGELESQTQLSVSTLDPKDIEMKIKTVFEMIAKIREELQSNQKQVNNIIQEIAKADLLRQRAIDRIDEEIEKKKLIEPLDMGDYFNSFIEWSKFLGRFSKKQDNVQDYFVCHDYQEAKRLYENYPNVFFLKVHLYHTDGDYRLIEAMGPKRLNRIVIVPDFNYIVPTHIQNSRIAYLYGKYDYCSYIQNSATEFQSSFFYELELIKFFEDKPNIWYQFTDSRFLHCNSASFNQQMNSLNSYEKQNEKFWNHNEWITEKNESKETSKLDNWKFLNVEFANIFKIKI